MRKGMRLGVCRRRVPSLGSGCTRFGRGTTNLEKAWKGGGYFSFEGVSEGFGGGTDVFGGRVDFEPWTCDLSFVEAAGGKRCH